MEVIDTAAFSRMVQDFRVRKGRDYTQAQLAREVENSLVDDSPYPLTSNISYIERGCPQGVSMVLRERIDTLANYMGVEVPTVKTNGAAKAEPNYFRNQASLSHNPDERGESDPETKALLNCCEALESLSEDRRGRVVEYLLSRYAK